MLLALYALGLAGLVFIGDRVYRAVSLMLLERRVRRTLAALTPDRIVRRYVDELEAHIALELAQIERERGEG